PERDSSSAAAIPAGPPPMIAIRFWFIDLFARFTTRFAAASARLRPALDEFTPDDIRNWASELGTETLIGSSGRVFPKV
ncbi:NAD(P)/FAD-dependent oxidoreductase, partial [Rhizobium leguminosarum]